MTACFNKMTAMSLTCSSSSTPLVPTRRSRPQIEIPKRLRICSIQNPVFIINNNNKRSIRVEASNSEEAPSPGLYSARKYELNAKNVDMVLEDVRPYLIADGGNVDVVSVDDDGVISLKLQGACESCPSSTTTMTMGIEKVLKEKFGDAVKEIRQVNDVEVKETTVKTVNNHLDILRPAIKNYGGSVEVLSVEGADCLVEYVGPESIGSGIKAAIKERFPDISNVVFTSS